MATSLQPLPQPGLPLIPGFTATAPATFLLKMHSRVTGRAVTGRAVYSAFYSSPAGEEGAPLLDIFHDSRNVASLRTPAGQEVMRIVKQNNWSSWKTISHCGVRSDGVEMWRLKISSRWMGTEYDLSILDQAASTANVSVAKKVQDADAGIMVNGQLAALMKKESKWKHAMRHDLVHVAPGMDILLAVGVAWIRANKQQKDATIAVAAMASAG